MALNGGDQGQGHGGLARDRSYSKMTIWPRYNNYYKNYY